MMRALIGLMAVIGLGGMRGQDQSVQAQTAPTLAEAKAEFQKHDRALNEVYAALKKDLEDFRFAVVREDQKGWMEYRDYVSEGQVRHDLGDPKKVMEYWEMAAGMTEARVSYLRAWKGIGEAGDWAGEYRDGRGGVMEIVESKEGIYFVLHAVRGPSFHVGVMGGLARTNESMARFSIPIEGSDEECWITLLNDLEGDGRIEVVTANSHEFHGARAYFGGKYLRVGLLDEKGKAEAVRRAKLGGMFE